MTLPYQIVDEGYARDLITQGAPSGHMDFYTVDFVIDAKEHADRLFSASYARYDDGRTTKVAFHERNVGRNGVFHPIVDFPEDIVVDFAAIERYTRERGDAAFAQELPFDERERQRRERSAQTRD